MRDVFDEIKGRDGRNRAYINFDDFKRACVEYKPECLKEMIEESLAKGTLDELASEIEEHFRNICESCSPTVDQAEAAKHGPSSPSFANKNDDGDDLLDDLGNMSIDEGVQSKPVKKFKPKPVPNYLKNTAASRAQQ